MKFFWVFRKIRKIVEFALYLAPFLTPMRNSDFPSLRTVKIPFFTKIWFSLKGNFELSLNLDSHGRLYYKGSFRRWSESIARIFPCVFHIFLWIIPQKRLGCPIPPICQAFSRISKLDIKGNNYDRGGSMMNPGEIINWSNVLYHIWEVSPDCNNPIKIGILLDSFTFRFWHHLQLMALDWRCLRIAQNCLTTFTTWASYHYN